MNALSLNDILARPDVWRGRLAGAETPALSSGFAALDAELPGGGWPRGALVELLADGAGFGECSLLLPALNAAREAGRWVVLIAPPFGLHAPALAVGGADCAKLAVIAPRTPRERLWAAEQTLASGAAGAVLCWAEGVGAAASRRLQVAAGRGAAPAFLFRPARERSMASAAPLRLLLAPGRRGALAIDVLKRRGPPCARTIFLEMPRPARPADHAVARPASAETRARSTRALALA